MEDVLKKSEEQIRVAQAEKNLIEYANKVITDETENCAKLMVEDILGQKGIKLDTTTATAFLEGMRFVLPKTKDEETNNMSLITLAILKVRENLIRENLK